jgi:serine/threonine protein kinase
MMHPKVFRAPELIFTGTVKNGNFFFPTIGDISCSLLWTSGVDVWAMGCLFVQMASGVIPFCCSTYTGIMRDMVGRLGSPTSSQLIQWGCGSDHVVPMDVKAYVGIQKKCAPWDISGVHDALKPTLANMLVYSLQHRFSSLSVRTSLYEPRATKLDSTDTP